MRPPLLPEIAALLGMTGDPPIDHVQTRTAIRLLSTLTLSLVVSILGVGLVAIMLIRRHRRGLLHARIAKGKRRPPPDPWFESARRVPDPQGGPKSKVIQLPGMGGSDDDTVDIDPEDLDEGDIEGDDQPNGGSPPRPPKPPTPPPASGPGSRGG